MIFTKTFHMKNILFSSFVLLYLTQTLQLYGISLLTRNHICPGTVDISLYNIHLDVSVNMTTTIFLTLLRITVNSALQLIFPPSQACQQLCEHKEIIEQCSCLGRYRNEEMHIQTTESKYGVCQSESGNRNVIWGLSF